MHMTLDLPQCALIPARGRGHKGVVHVQLILDSRLMILGDIRTPLLSSLQ